MIDPMESSRSHFPVACDPVSRPKEIDYSGANSYFLTSTLVTQWPYGEEITNQTQDNQSHKYTGHERDFESNLDYMHARYYSPFQGRFLGVDPALESAHRDISQSWNRYSYTWGNPMHYIDETGKVLELSNSTFERQKQLQALKGMLMDRQVAESLIVKEQITQHSFLGIKWTTSKFILTSTMDLSKSKNPLAQMLGDVIDSDEVAKLSFTKSSLSETGGAESIPKGAIQGDPNRHLLKINPNQFPSIVPTPSGGVYEDLNTALAHELLGHIRSYMLTPSTANPLVPGLSNVQAVDAENKARKWYNAHGKHYKLRKAH